MQGGNRKGKGCRRPRACLLYTSDAADYGLAALWAAEEDVRSLKSLILFGLKGMAAYAYHARALGRTDPAVNAFFYEALEAIGAEKTPDELLALVLKADYWWIAAAIQSESLLKVPLCALRIRTGQWIHDVTVRKERGQ